MKPRSRLACLAVAAALTLVAASDALARIYPAWALAGPFDVDVSPGFVSVSGSFTFPLGGAPTTAGIHYDDEPGHISGAGLSSSLTLYSLTGTYTVDPGTHEQHVSLADITEPPLFTFEGVVSPTGGDIVGTYVKKAGYLDYPGDESGPLTLHRTGVAAKSAFDFTFAPRMDTRGRIKGALALDGKTETTAAFTLYDGRKVEGGKIRGKMKTDKFGVTTAAVKIRGAGWKADLTGPVDVDGFHATIALDAVPFSMTGIPVVLRVQPGPEPPDGKPPKPPANLLSGATATIVNGQVTVTHSAVPSKFFGTKAGLSIQFPFSDGIGAVAADVTTASTAEPRRCIVTLGSKVYNTIAAPVGNGVTFDIRKVSTAPGFLIEVLATGRVYGPGGKIKNVNVLVQAAVQ